MSSETAAPPEAQSPNAKVEGIRQEDRFAVDWHAKVGCPDWKIAEQIAAGNVSRGGMFLRTDRELSVGARVEVTLQLPNQGSIELMGIVRHVVGPSQQSPQGAGVGVEIDEANRNELMALVEIARIRQGKAPEAPPPAEARSPAAAAAPPRRTVGLPPGKRAEIVGIDFGVSFSQLAVACDDTVWPVPDAFGRSQHPSLVCYAVPPNEPPVAGWDARKLQLQHPEHTIGSVKRLLGRGFSDPHIGGLLHSAAFRSSEGPGDTILIELQNGPTSVPQICADVLRHLCGEARKQLERDTLRAVLTHPVTFGQPQLDALGRAAKLADIDVVGFVSEPLAGALAFGHGQASNEIVAVYDLGGGTFDFTVLELSATHFRVLACDGDAWLGGDDFDRVLAEAVASAFWKQSGVELQRRVVEWQRLVLTCERAKRRLTTDDVTVIDLPQIVLAPQPFDLKQRIDRAALERICQPLLETSLDVCREVLNAAGLQTSDLGGLLVIGGSTRIPFIHRGVTEFFGRQSGTGVQPDDAVALGAGMYAARLAGHAAHQARSMAI